LPDEELSQFIENLQNQIQNGLTEKFYIKGDIEIELSVVTKKDIGGRFKILVAEGGGNFKKEELSKIKFKIAERQTGRAIVSGPLFKKTRGFY